MFLKSIVFFVSALCQTNELAMKQDHSRYDYFVAKDGVDALGMEAMSKDLGVQYIGRVGQVAYGLFRSAKADGVAPDQVVNKFYSSKVGSKYGIEDFIHDKPKQKVRLSVPAEETDGFKKQWYLDQKRTVGTLKVQDLWKQGITGKNVTVAILDDGLNYEHEDLAGNYSPASSYDFSTNSSLPYPHDDTNTHGTPCAGIVAAKRTGKCGSGIAYAAKLSGIRLPMVEVSDSQDAIALNYEYQKNDIYSNSWGPGANPKKIYPLSDILEQALQRGVDHGRGGLGNIFVFASGNSAAVSDNCAFIGYLNSIHTITVGAINKYEKHIAYSEGCSNLMVTAYSSDAGDSDIHTTASRGNNCQPRFSGTSAAAPMVSGLVALALSKRPDLTWRDVQHLLIRSARRVDPSHRSWRRTYSGRYYSNQYGYGVVDGGKLLAFLNHHRLIEPQLIIQTSPIYKNDPLAPAKRPSQQSYTDHIHITRDMLGTSQDMLLEHVVVNLTIRHEYRATLTIKLVSPNNIVSYLIVSRSRDASNEGFDNYPVMTLAHWDEPAYGIWTLEVTNQKTMPAFKGTFVSWSMTFFGRNPNPNRSVVPKPKAVSTTPAPITIKVKDEF